MLDQLIEFAKSYPIPAVLVAAVAFVAVSYWMGNARPGFPGKIIGVVRVYGFYGRSARFFRGLFTDITHEVLTEEAIDSVREIALHEVDDLLSQELPESRRKALEKVREYLSSVDSGRLKEKIKVYGCRRDWGKHVWVFLSHKPLEAVALQRRGVFMFPYGVVTTNDVYGVRIDIPGVYIMKPYGRVRLHLFMPVVDPEEDTYRAQLTQLSDEERSGIALLGSAVRTAMLYARENNRLRAELKAARRRIEELGRKYSDLSRELDIARTAVQAKTLLPMTEEEAEFAKLKPTPTRYMELLVASTVGALTGGMLLPKLLGLDPVLSSVLGCILVGVIVYSRISRR